MKYADLAGQQFGRWTVLGFAEMRRQGARWLCRCTCGVERAVWAFDLVGGTSQSCGCLRVEACTSHGRARRSQPDRTYESWAAMNERCYRSAAANYPRYGGRGIRVCDRWRHSFENFLADMGTRPPGKTLDRISSDGHYEPANCRWATPAEQARNRRRPHVRESTTPASTQGQP